MTIPNHVAIIPDGNRRWAKEQGLPTFEGHRRGFNQMIEIGKRARKIGVKVLTLWMFSTENWDRSDTEKRYLWKLFEEGIKSHLKIALREKIKIIHIGRRDRIPGRLVKQIDEVIEKTKTFSKYYLVIALDYGGQDEILRAAEEIRNSKFELRKLTEKNFSKLLDTGNLPYPDPDLIIRPGKEKRLSGFMIWQGAYAELIFVDKYMPEFTADDFETCIKNYVSRQRRFGK